MNNIRFLYENNIKEFLEADADSIIGAMVQNTHGNLMTTTRESWESEIEIMKATLESIKSDGKIITEVSGIERF